MPTFGVQLYTKEWVWRSLVAAILCQHERSAKVISFCNKQLFPLYKHASDFIDKADSFKKLLEENDFKFADKQVPWVVNIASYLLNHNYQLPTNKTGLMRFPGVGEHVAELICSNCYGQPYLARDVHVNRIIQRVGLDIRLLTEYTTEHPASLSNKMTSFGREFCSYQPKCSKCPLYGSVCQYKERHTVTGQQLELNFS